MKILTWNMQGAGSNEETSNASDVLTALHNGIDILLLQETGGYPDWGLKPTNCGGVTLMEGERNFGSSRWPKWAHIIWYDSTANTKAKHDRCSMAVIATNYSGRYGVVSHHSDGLRPLIGIKTNDGIWAYSIHAPSGNHKSASGVAASLLSVISKEKYVCAGDYNCSPADMQWRGYAPTWTAGRTHQNGNTLDFAIGNKVAVTAYAGGSSMPAFVSDHYSRCFEVQ
ncbi:endonuclease/exonuclease/phosphatase family protein [Azospirillum picis]|uniref:Endonuclease/exonuclease/phosphatase domain-containing protein n=1 Tax=Azospirillum picis TaxID=488438 RepID=A0ABU0MF52_9PROT|nr:endonuclease/exonuclease/phosphatase family protein [Azospirillum picis]MBP2298218.1 hypothetical protein [Azospirillum picis]MDQ0532056.1 hypothetical protein [Azospirillum picis]